MFYKYDREKAAKYAREWALSRNPRFKDYEEWGGNCTNFISQCLNAGGIPMDESGDNVMMQWYWYSDSNRTPSWTASEPFFRYLISNNNSNTSKFGVYAEECNYEDLNLGDLVQLIEENKAYHTMIISAIVLNEGKVEDYLVCQNTYDLLDYPLSLKIGYRRYIKINGYYM